MMTAPHDRLRIRLYLGGQPTDERWIGLADPDDTAQVGMVHAAAAAEADATDTPWFVEVFDPDMPEEAAYRRFGTDTAGMVLPMLNPDGPVIRPESFRVAGRRYPPGASS